MSWRVKENRRAAPRHRYEGDNTRIGLEGSLTRQCQVLDLSQTGVRLAVTNADSLPNEFNLFLSTSRSGRSVRVKWRRGNEIGAEFITATRVPASPGTPSGVKPQRAESQSSKSRMSTLSSHAPSQQRGDPQLKDTRAAVISTSYEKAETGSISGDKANVGVSGGDKPKIEARRQITDVGEQLDKANQEKDNKKRLDLSRLEKELGPNRVALIQALKDVEPDSPDGRELASIIESLTRPRTGRS